MDQGSLFNDTLEAARNLVKAGLDEGIKCPCCGRFAKRYHRAINSSQASQLILLYRLNERHGRERFFHRTQIIQEANNNDLAYLRHRGLLEPKTNEDKTKKDSGSFRITEIGRRFVLKQISIPKYVIQFNDFIEGVEGPLITIKDALGVKFNYEELMR